MKTQNKLICGILVVAAIIVVVFYFMQKPAEIVPTQEPAELSSEQIFLLKICNTPNQLVFPEAIYDCGNDGYYFKIPTLENMADMPSHGYLDINGDVITVCGGGGLYVINDTCSYFDETFSCDKTVNLCENVQRNCNYVSKESNADLCYYIWATDTKNATICDNLDESMRSSCIAEVNYKINYQEYPMS